MVNRGTKRLFLLMLTTVIGMTACGDEGDVNIEYPPTPDTGSMLIYTVTLGDEWDDSYGVSIDGSSAGTIGPNDSRTFSGLSEGRYSVLLTDIASNCDALGNNPQTLYVVDGQTTTHSFYVLCENT